jgi:hypothetical protein
MSNLFIIVQVAVVAFVGSALIVLAVYCVDKGAERHDRRR